MNHRDRAIYELGRIGIAAHHVDKLRRIAKSLHRWHELECGTEQGHIERDEQTGRTYLRRQFLLNGVWQDIRTATADREASAIKRLNAIMAEYPSLQFFIQGDPRGCALYILQEGEEYPNGIGF